MDAHLTNLNKARSQCFFAKKMTYFESSDFVHNEEHLSNCEDCRLKIAQFDLQKELILKDFAGFAADEEISQALEAELEEIIPTITNDDSQMTLPKRAYSLSVKDFFVFLIFGIPRKIQFFVVASLILAACIY